MWRLIVVGLIGVCAATASISWAQQPGVISPDDLEAAKAIERNTYRSEAYGISITKPEGWFLVGANELTGEPTIPHTKHLSFLGYVAGVFSFPPENQWVLINPSVVVEVYDVVTPFTQEEVANIYLKDIQAIVGAFVQITMPPTPVSLNGKEWIRAGYFWRGATHREGERTQSYQECYFRIEQQRLILIQVTARPADVPTYRAELDSIIQSVTIEPSPAQHVPEKVKQPRTLL